MSRDTSNDGKLAAWMASAGSGLTEMPTTPMIARRFGCSANSAMRMVERLEQAGIVTVDRARRGRPRITYTGGANV